MIRRYVFEFIIFFMLECLTVDQCDRCEESHKECVRRDTQVHGASCMQCAKAKKGCNLTKGQSKINFIPNDPKVCL
jgi:hypothetical protein